jgi:hypothetical protein
LIRLRSVIARIGMSPDSAQKSPNDQVFEPCRCSDILTKVFYRNTREVVEILSIHHAAQDERRTT